MDDLGFWPATATSLGINAWIAIDDMPMEEGGTFAVSVGSHRASWRQDAYEMTGATPTFPSNGYTSAMDMIQNRVGYGTCNLKTAAPDIHSKLESNRRIYNLQAGDVIFHTRWLFHRTVPFASTTSFSNKLLKKRYSIRYVPGSSELPKGWSGEWSILSNPNNAGRTLDEVARLDGPWYPKCWPTVDGTEMQSSFLTIQTERMPHAQQLYKEKMNEIKPFLKQLELQQRQPLQTTTIKNNNDKEL